MAAFFNIVLILSLFSANISRMLQRFVVHLGLVILFALTQMGVATHEISHFTDLTQHTQQHGQQDKNAPNHQCEQCISHAGIADGLASEAFVFAVESSVSIAAISLTSLFFSTSHQPYSARAPPQIA